MLFKIITGILIFDVLLVTALGWVNRGKIDDRT
jgi:hypothetical protein